MTFKQQLQAVTARFSDMSEAEWAEHDRQVAAKQLAEKAEDQARAVALTRDRLVAGGAPERFVARAWSDAHEPGIEAMGMVDDFGPLCDRPIRVLAGGVGSGKTWAAIRWLGESGGHAPLFLRANAFEAAGRYDKALRQRWQRCSALVLDDLGAEYLDAKGNLNADLDELVDHFTGARAMLLITTNLEPDAFRSRYGERIVSRMREYARWKSIKAPDRRGR